MASFQEVSSRFLSIKYSSMNFFTRDVRINIRFIPVVGIDQSTVTLAEEDARACIEPTPFIDWLFFFQFVMNSALSFFSFS